MKNEQTTSTVNIQAGQPFPCGCTITTPHSHLVAGHNCPCEQGREGVSAILYKPNSPSENKK